MSDLPYLAIALAVNPGLVDVIMRNPEEAVGNLGLRLSDEELSRVIDMAYPKFKGLRVNVPGWAVNRRVNLLYLAVNFHREGLGETVHILETKPTEEFFALVGKHVDNYMKKGEMPPDDIAPAIMNIAEDLTAGKTPHIRSGDYYALQQHLRLLG